MMKNTDTWAVLGGGFRGMVASHYLVKKGYNVKLYEGAKRLGGVLYSDTVDGFTLDKGCHLFINDSNVTTDFVREMLPDGFKGARDINASILGKVKTEGMVIPDFTSLGIDTCKAIFYESVNLLGRCEGPANNLKEELQGIHGVKAAGLLSSFIFKSYRLNAEQIETNAYNLITFPVGRIKILDDRVGKILKSIPYLDAKLAISSQNDPMQFVRSVASNFDTRVFYPKGSGLREFCESVSKGLIERGVDVNCNVSVERVDRSGEKLKILFHDGKVEFVDKIFWAGSYRQMSSVFGVETKIADYIHAVPMVLNYYFVEKNKVSEHTYIHFYDDEDALFRASIPPNYGDKMCPEDMSYICCETPVSIGSKEWGDPRSLEKRNWESLIKYGFVHGEYLKAETFKTPVSYSVPLVGFANELESLASKCNDPRILGLNQLILEKNSIISHVLKEFEEANI